MASDRDREPSSARRLRRPLAVATVALGLLSVNTAGALADVGDPLDYYGGPVAHAMTTVLVDWGPDVNPVFTNATTGDPGLFKYFAAHSGNPGYLGGVLMQYMDSTGSNAANSVAYGGQFQITPTVTSATVQDSQVAAQLVSQIEANVLPHPQGTGLEDDYVVLFPPDTTVCDDSGCSGQSFCSYHGSTQLPDGAAVLYDVIPDDTVGPMTQGCGQQSSLRNQTMYMSHEWAETITDPLVDDATALGPPLAWYDANCPQADSLCGEAADKCNQEPTLNGDWTVQLVWSNLDDACVGTENRYGTPTVTLTGPAAAPPGALLSFTATASDPAANIASATWDGHDYTLPAAIASLIWNWGDGTPDSSGADVVHTFVDPGIYTVSATATDELGFTSTVTEAVSVWGPSGEPITQTALAAAIHARTATLEGSINPAGVTVTYRFDYGRTATALDHLTPELPGPSGTVATDVRDTVTGLDPATTYFYRLDTIVSGQALAGPVERFRTLAAPSDKRTASSSHANPQAVAAAAHGRTQRRRRRPTRRRRPILPARFRLALIRFATTPLAAPAVEPVRAAAVPGQALRGELARGLRVSFRCAARCHVRLQATLVLPGTLGLAAVPRILASGTGTLARGGEGVANLRFTTSARAWLATRRTAAFAVSGFASSFG